MSPGSQAPPLAVITSTDHGGEVVIASVLGLTFVLLAFLIRVYVRRGLGGSWSHDDNASTVATILCTALSIASIVGVSTGFGKTRELLDESHILRVQKIDYSISVLYVAALYLSKSSATLLFLRLSPQKNHIRFCWIILAVSSVWAVASIFAVALRCQFNQPWVLNGQCTSLFLRWQIVAAFDVMTEVALFVMAIFLVSGLQMSLRFKAFILLAFAFRLPVIACIFLRLIFVNIEIASSDATFDGVTASIWTLVQVDYGIIASTIPCLRHFMVACNTGWGNAAGHTGHGSMVGKSNNSYGMHSIGARSPGRVLSYRPDRRSKTQQALEAGGVDASTRRAVNPATEQTAEWPRDSNDSTQMIIRKETTYTVQYDKPSTASKDALYTTVIESQV